MAKKKIGAYITLDGEKEFRAATSACNKSLATMKSEMKLVEAQTTGSANTLDTLQKKHDVLSRTLEEQVKKEEAVRDGLRHAEEQYEKVGGELESYRKKLEEAQSTLAEMKQSSETTSDALNEQSERVEQLEQIVNKGEQTYQRAGNRVNDWRKQLNNAEAQTIRATRALNENDAYLKEAEHSYDSCAKSIDQFGNKTDGTAEKLTEFGTILKANLKNTAVDIGKDAFRNATEGAIELDAAQRQLQASTGATAQATREYSAEMQDLYSSGYGDSINDAANGMALVKQYTNETDPSKIKELAESGMALDETFGIELSESIRAADALMENMGLTAEQAFDYMAKGAQNGLNKSGELADNITEYSQLWAQAGFSAEEMFAIMDNGLDSGAYNLDKVNDFAKEFGNSLADGRIEQNLKAFSSDTQELFYQWKSGEATTKQVFQSVIADLASMENKQQALTIASNTWSALGEDNAMKVITSLNSVNNTYKNVQGTMEEVKNIKYDGVANQWKALGRTFQTDVMAPMLKEFLPEAEAGMEFLTDNIEGIATAAKVATPVVAGMFAVKKGKELIKDLNDTQKGIKGVIKWVTAHTAAKTAETAVETASTGAKTANTVATTAGTAATAAHSAATTVATAAQTAFNAALMANPAGVVLLGLVAVTGVVAALTGEIETATTRTDELTEATDKSIKKLDEAEQNLGESTWEWSNALSSLAAQEGVADDLVTELYDLEAQSGKTDEQIGRMNVIVGQLNSMFPELSLSVDGNTGALSQNEQQTRRSINAALELSKASAAQEKMAEIADDLVEAEMAKYEAEQNLKDIGDELTALEEERARITKESSKATEDGTQAYVEYNGKMMDAQTALMEISEAESTLTEKQGEQEEALDGLVEKYDEANSQYQSAYEYAQNLTGETERNTEATNQNTEAVVANGAAIAAKQAMAASGIETVNEEAFAYQNLSATQQQLAVDVTNGVLTMQENVQNALESQMNMFEQFDGGVQISTEQLLANMQSQVDGVTAWEQNLSSLADKGINQGILQKLAEMGPQGSGYVTAFNNMTSEQLAQANSLWVQSVDIKGMTDQWGQQLLESGAANIAGGMQNLTPIMQQSGANTVMGLVQGMQQAQKTAEAQGTNLGVKVIDSVNDGLGVHSPSAKTTQSGLYVDQGLANGMTLGRATVMIAALGVSTMIVTQINTSLSESKFTGAGLNVSEGLALGIRQGKSEVIQAATEVAEAAIEAANNKLEIHSPSHVFRRMGNNTMDSYALGVKDRETSVRNSVTGALNFEEVQGKVNTRTGSASIAEQQILRNMLVEAMSQIKLVAYLGSRQVTRELSNMGVVFRAEI